MQLQRGRNWGRSVWLLHRTVSLQGRVAHMKTSRQRSSWNSSSVLMDCVPFTYRRMSRVLCVISADLGLSTWTPPTQKDAPAASALEPQTSVTALTKDAQRYSCWLFEILETIKNWFLWPLHPDQKMWFLPAECYTFLQLAGYKRKKTAALLLCRFRESWGQSTKGGVLELFEEVWRGRKMGAEFSSTS